MMPGIFNSVLPHGQPETIIALASQGLSVEDISTQLGLDQGIILNVLKGDHPTPEEVTTEEAAQIKAALLREANETDDPYLRTKIRLELFKERPSARKMRAAQAGASATNFNVIQQLLVAADNLLIERDRHRATDSTSATVIGESSEATP